MARTAGASEDQIATVATWRHSPFFDDAERAALALADAATRPATDGGLSDEQWEDLARHFSEKQCAAWPAAAAAMARSVRRARDAPIPRNCLLRQQNGEVGLGQGAQWWRS
ncbi:carboxymuconolactone decarboxylase family protein [Nocardia sp. NPDC049149]|uniref:carboxymuconolactone decarboxylase family protein n=1 Tax=Nocardia sp. NPDC049149 TaxID=3364315 RepID=UPI003721E916